MTMRLKNNSSLYLFCIYLCGIIIASVNIQILPDKYFIDSIRIQEYIESLGEESFSTLSYYFFSSYRNTAGFFALLGLNENANPWLVRVVCYSLAFIPLVIAQRTGKARCDWRPYAILAVWNVILAIYLGQYSKDVIAILLVGMILFLSGKGRLGMLLVIIIVASYALFFRIYWFLALAYFLSLYLIWKVSARTIYKILFFILALICIFYSNHLFTGQYLSDARFNINITRGGSLDPDAVTLIDNIVENSSILSDLTNTIIAWIMLLFPFYLFRIAGFHHIVFAIWEMVNVIVFARIVQALAQSSKSGRENKAQSPRWSDPRVRTAIFWCIAFSLTQGSFEPDFGSFARHQIILLPMYFFVLLMWFDRTHKKFTFSHQIRFQRVTKGKTGL